MTQAFVLKCRNLVIMVSAALSLAACAGGDFKFTGTPPADFGDVLVFTTSAPQTLTWQNKGAPHEVLGGKAEASPPFGIVGTFTAATIPANGNVSLQYSFTPEAIGAANGEAKLQTNRMAGRAKSEKVALKGNGVFYISDGTISISETAGGGAPAQAIDFGKVLKGASKTLTIFVKNAAPAGGAAAATTVNWSRNNQGFSSAPAQGAAVNIPANGSTQVTITFTPPDVGLYADSVTFKDAAGKIVTGVMVKGEGVKGE